MKKSKPPLKTSGRPKRPIVLQEKSGSANRLVHVRHRRSNWRKIKARFTINERRRFSDELAQNLYRQSSNFNRILKQRRKSCRVSLVNFSMLNNAESSIKKLIEVTAVARHSKRYYIDFEDKYCRDIGAYLLFAMIYKKVRNSRGLGGNISPAVNKVLTGLGIDKYAKIRLPKENPFGVHPLPLEIHTTRKNDSLSYGRTDTTVDKAAQRVVKAISDWIAECNFAFQDAGNQQLLTGLTEVFENARHSTKITVLDQKIGTWAVTGFMAKRLENTEPTTEIQHWCHLSIVTIGETVASTLKAVSLADDYRAVRAYVSRHKGVNGLSEEALFTVAAVQDGISSDGIGGCGLGKIVSMIETLGGLKQGKEAPILSLVSGNTCLTFKEPYNAMLGESGASSQFFNKLNNNMEAPDVDFVKNMSVFFPGTIISARFLIDHKFMQEAIENSSQ